jgi:hypothetical protein
MGDLKPLGSEKLQGMDKIKRILEIAKYNETPKQNINELNTTNYTIQLADGLTYGIVKEKLGYIIKKGLNESTLDYADQMRQRKYFRSYSEAMKKLNLTAAELNRVYENEEGISLIGEQAGQKKKFVLKLPKGGNKTPDVGSDPMPAPPPAEPTTPQNPQHHHLWIQHLLKVIWVDHLQIQEWVENLQIQEWAYHLQIQEWVEHLQIQEWVDHLQIGGYGWNTYRLRNGWRRTCTIR